MNFWIKFVRVYHRGLMIWSHCNGLITTYHEIVFKIYMMVITIWKKKKKKKKTPWDQTSTSQSDQWYSLNWRWINTRTLTSLTTVMVCYMPHIFFVYTFKCVTTWKIQNDPLWTVGYIVGSYERSQKMNVRKQKIFQKI